MRKSDQKAKTSSHATIALLIHLLVESCKMQPLSDILLQLFSNFTTNYRAKNLAEAKRDLMQMDMMTLSTIHLTVRQSFSHFAHHRFHLKQETGIIMKLKQTISHDDVGLRKTVCNC